MDKGARKIITMHSALYPRNDIEIVCVKKEGKRGLVSIQDSVDA